MKAGRLILAPMQGVADDVLRDILTRVGGYDWSVTEFVRVCGVLLPKKAFTRISPELKNGGRTPSGTPVRVQLLGSDPHWLGVNASALAALGPFGVDLNFGCPAPTVNRHRGGAALLNEPELLQQIVAAVRAAVPRPMPVSAKMRLGISDPSRAIACAQAIEAGGAAELVVHARTKADGYRPPAKWTWIESIQAAVSIPVIGNGDVFTVEDYWRLRELTGCEDVMLGRGAVADPYLALRIRGERPAVPCDAEWRELLPLLAVFWRLVKAKVKPHHAAGRLKMWLNPLRKNFVGAEQLFQTLRLFESREEIDQVLAPVLPSVEHASSRAESREGDNDSPSQ